MNALLRKMLERMGGAASKTGSDMAAHMGLLTLLALNSPFGKVVEIGVGGGWSTIALLTGVRAVGCRLASYDISAECGRNVEALAEAAMGKSPLDSWDFRVLPSVAAVEDFKPGSVSLLFIDITHTYEDTKNELTVWLPKMHAGGIMCGKDYFIHEDTQGKDRSGVKRAVDEFAVLHEYRFNQLDFLHDQGLFVLWPK